jgi:hypothetical protein
MRTRVYVAGPISKGPLEQNIRQATDAGMELLRAGFAPLVPHLTCYMAGPAPEVLPHGTAVEDWYGVDLPWVAVADAVVRLPGDSVGADKEVALAKELGIPVYDSVGALLENPPTTGDDRFHALLAQIGKLHDRKQADYGRAGDPFANVRASQNWGIAPWLGALLRAGDKVARLQKFALAGRLANEGVEDSMMDLAVYALIALILYRKKRP